MVDGEVTPASTGCGKLLGGGCLGYLGLMVLLVAAGLAWNAFSGDSKQIHMQGDVVISRLENFVSDSRGSCSGTGALVSIRGGSHVSVNPSSGKTREMLLSSGRLNDQGSCAFFFAGDIQVADLYEIGVNPATTKRLQYNFIDTIGDNGDTILSPSIRVD